MGKSKTIIHDTGAALTERQKNEVEDSLLKLWKNDIEPSMTDTITRTVEGALNNRAEINCLNRGLGRFKLFGVIYFKTTIAANMALIIAIITALILIFKK
ncbi:MAG: hypothetical protein HC905_22760 [Bacteroidales bacterium]|nr:hypothetical protein [Bacteroidales bacterium]